MSTSETFVEKKIKKKLSQIKCPNWNLKGSSAAGNFLKVKLFLNLFNLLSILYDNAYTLIIDTYTSMNTFIDLKSWALALQNILDTLSGILYKCLRFSLIMIESVSISQAKPCLVLSSQSVVYTFLLKMLSLVLIKN